MKIHSTSISFGRESIDAGLWAIQHYLMNRFGVDVSQRDMAPLKHYVYSGRASGFFLRNLFSAKPYMIARKLHEGGSDDEIMDRVKAYLTKHTDYAES